MIGNESYEKKQLRKRVLRLNSFCLKKFAQNVIAGIWELWIVVNSFCDDILQKANQLKEFNLCHDPRI